MWLHTFTNLASNQTSRKEALGVFGAGESSSFTHTAGEKWATGREASASPGDVPTDMNVPPSAYEFFWFAF